MCALAVSDIVDIGMCLGLSVHVCVCMSLFVHVCLCLHECVFVKLCLHFSDIGECVTGCVHF